MDYTVSHTGVRAARPRRAGEHSLGQVSELARALAQGEKLNQQSSDEELAQRLRSKTHRRQPKAPQDQKGTCQQRCGKMSKKEEKGGNKFAVAVVDVDGQPSKEEYQRAEGLWKNFHTQKDNIKTDTVNPDDME